MTKKVLLFIGVITILLFANSMVFATNVNNMGNDIKNAVNNTGHAVQGAINTTTNAVTQGANTAGNAVQNTVNGVTNATGVTGTRTTTGTNNLSTRATTNNTGYNTARTATGGDNIRNNTMTWLILGITAAVIIGLIWFYVAQRDDDEVKSNR